MELPVNNKFTKDLDDLVSILNAKKQKIKIFLKKNFRENIDFIYYNLVSNKKKNLGGHNKIIYMLTEETYELVKNTYNLKHRYVPVINNTKHINIVMSIENQTIGFIENSFKNIIDVKRQYPFDKYKVDLYFPNYKLVIECDENNHNDRNEEYERTRENYIISLNNNIIRYNPNDKLFDLSIVLREINKFLFAKEIKDYKVMNIQF